jgi:Domain of unknown function (DUF4386)
MSKKSFLIAAGSITIIESLLIFAPMAILGAAIGWPASLDFTPARVLPLIAENLTQVRLGYGIYLLYSVFFAGVGAAIAWLSCRKEGMVGGVAVVVNLAVGLACASALARCIGIIRWLTASNELATLHQNDTANSALAIEVTQRAVNAWGGAIGENLGVSLFAALWLIAVSSLIVTHQSLPKWLGYSGFCVAVLLGLQASELFGVQLMSVSASSSALHFWLLAVGIVALRQGLTRA